MLKLYWSLFGFKIAQDTNDSDTGFWRVLEIENLIVFFVLFILHLCQKYHSPILFCDILRKNMLWKSNFPITISRAELYINFLKIHVFSLTCSDDFWQEKREQTGNCPILQRFLCLKWDTLSSTLQHRYTNCVKEKLSLAPNRDWKYWLDFPCWNHKVRITSYKFQRLGRSATGMSPHSHESIDIERNLMHIFPAHWMSTSCQSFIISSGS